MQELPADDPPPPYSKYLFAGLMIYKSIIYLWRGVGHNRFTEVVRNVPACVEEKNPTPFMV